MRCPCDDCISFECEDGKKCYFYEEYYEQFYLGGTQNDKENEKSS